MADIKETTERTPEELPAVQNKAASPDSKKKSIDEMIEEFNRDNPVNNQKKIYRGVF